VRLAAGDTDHSGSLTEVVTASGSDAGSKPVKIYDDDGDAGSLLSNNPLDAQFTAFAGNVGVCVAFANTLVQVYADTDTPLEIPDEGTSGDPLKATIQVPRSAGIVRDVNVFLAISHTFDSDLAE
jgi:hypothetical protein